MKDGKRMKISAENSNKIANMSLLCAILVVSIHMGYGVDKGTIIHLIYSIFTQGYSRIAVPFFFVVSGFFLAQHFSEDGWWIKELRKRVVTIVIPFLCWAMIDKVFPFVTGAPLSIIADIIHNRPFGTSIYIPNVLTWKLLGFKLDDYPASVPLWYLRALMMFVIISPVWIRVLRKCWWLILPILFIVPMFLFKLLPGPEQCGLRGFLGCGFSLSGLFYFSIGMLISEKKISMKNKFVGRTAGSVGSLIIILQTAFSFMGLESPIGTTVAIPFMIYATWYYMPSKPLPDLLKGMSFPIYLMHLVSLTHFGFLMRALHITGVPYEVLKWIYACIVPIIVANLLRKHTPRIFKILFGGR